MTIYLLLSLAFFASQQDGTARAKTAIEKVRAQKSYRTEFTAVIKVPDSDPMEMKGEALWVAGNILFVQYRAAGGDIKRIVRAGDQAWVYDERPREWLSPEEFGMSDVGRGVQNPDEVLSILAKQLQKAALAGKGKVGDRECDVINIKLAGADLEQMTREQAQQASIEWKESAAEARICVGNDDLIYQFTSHAALVSTDPNIKGKSILYDADIKVLGFNDRFLMSFMVAGEPAPFDAFVLTGIESRPGTPKEFADEVASLREARIASLIADLASEKRDVAAMELKQFGTSAISALKQVLEDKERGGPARAILAAIEK